MIITTRQNIGLEPGKPLDDAIIKAVRETGIREVDRGCGKTASAISLWINGQVRLSTKTCRAICKAAGCLELFEEAMQ